MDNSLPWMLYGAYGFTGVLLAEEARARGIRPLLAGRDRERLEALGKRLDLPTRCLALDDPAALRAALGEVSLVLHAAGPFSRTAAPMRRACLERGIHYLDITGEIDVLEATHACGPEAQSAGIACLSGVGFDVVPSDCLAVHLARRLPGATRLELALHGTASLSPGTSKTILENLAEGGRIRRGGRIEAVPPAWATREVPFSCGPRLTFTIPWGDVSTAYHSTGIPEIRVYSSTTPGALPWIRSLAWLGPLLRSRLVQGLGSRAIEAWVPGPDEEARTRARSYLWGRVEDDSGAAVEATLETPEGYRLTTLAALEVTGRVLRGDCPPGAWTPAEAFGPELVLALPEVELVDRDP